MKLAAIYNIWDGEELFKYSLESIDVDDVIIIWQETSNFGEKHDPFYAIAGNGYLHKFHPDLTISGQENELNKRMLGIRLAAQRGNTHYMFIDSDEVYNKEQFKAAKEKAFKYDITACRLYTYYHSPEYRLTPLEEYYVPFICKIKEGMFLPTKENPYFVYADPTRGFRTKWDSTYIFKPDELMMHHFSYVRRDIGRKLRNSSARGNFGNIEAKIKQFNEWEIGKPLINFKGYDVEPVTNEFQISI